MPTRPSPRVIRDENERLREQLDEVKQSCLLLNHKVEGSETILSKQKEVILDLRQQLQAQELRHTEELRALNDAHSQVLKNFVQKHSIQVQGLEKKLRSLQNIVATSIVQKEPEKESDVQAAQPAAAATQ